MSGFDWIIVIFISLSVLVAIAQGFFFELFSLGGAVAGYLLAAWQYQALAPVFLPYVKTQAIANMAGFLTIFFTVVLLAGMAGRVARWAMREVGLGWMDRTLGGAFGLLRGLIVVTVALMALTAFAPESRMLAASSLRPYFLLAGRTAAYLAPAEVRARFKAGEETLRGLRAAGAQSNKPAAEDKSTPVKQ